MGERRREEGRGKEGEAWQHGAFGMHALSM